MQTAAPAAGDRGTDVPGLRPRTGDRGVQKRHKRVAANDQHSQHRGIRALAAADRTGTGIGVGTGTGGCPLRLEELRVGKQCVCTCRFWWSAYHLKNKKRIYI